MPAAGPQSLAVLAATLRQYAARDLRLELLRGTKRAGKPVIEAARRNATDRLPRGGGLNTETAAEKITTRVRLGVRTAGVQIRTADRLLNQTNAGYVRHPTFGRRGKGQWKVTETPLAAGWWDDAISETTPQAIAEMYAVMRETAEAIMLRVRVGGL
jgi:hypothetical protein